MRTTPSRLRYCFLAAAAVALAVTSIDAQTVSTLNVTAATSKRVELAWIGSAPTYTVQRRVLGAAWSTIATVTNSTYSDAQIDPYLTYEYQVTANAASVSNSVRVGPPPAGLSAAAPAPLRGATPVDNYGFDLSVVLDANGDPAFLFGWGDPKGASKWTDSGLLFRSWNRARYDWNPVVTIATIGDVLSRFRSSSSLAFDASSNTFAAASEQDDGSVNLFVSTDGGATFTKRAMFQSVVGGASWRGPSVALSNGILHLALVSSDTGLHYVTGSLASDPATWIDKIASTPAATSPARFSTTISLALDSAGNPAIAYWADDMNLAYNEVLLFWKPNGAAGPVRVMDSQGQQSDELSVKLAFFNLNPRILSYTQRTDAPFGVRVHFVRSDDAGISWQTPVVIPPDGDASTDFPFDLALNSKGEAAASFGQNSSSGGAACGNPKLTRSTDLAHWTTCAIADKSLTANYSPIPGSVQLAFGGNDKLYLLWWEQGDTQANSGILMYREAPAGALAGPVITSVVDGASFRPNIVPGSWVTIQGANLSDTTRTWADADFHGNALPTNLSGVQVKMNGLDAPVYYVSPTQLNVQAPANISGSVSVQVTRDGLPGNTLDATVVPNAPALFSYPAGGKTYPAAVYLNSQIVGDPAVAGTNVAKAHTGDRILLFATGLVPSPAGTIIQSPIVSTSPVTVTVGGVDALVEFAGLVASGEFQINIVLPPLRPGEYPVVVEVAGQQSQPGVIIPVQ